MSAKQDRVAPRTATDLERKYNFGERFSEILGLIDDTRKDVDSTSSELRDEIREQSTSIRRDTQEIVMEATKTVNGVKTTTGYTFDDEGMTVSKDGSGLTTKITEDGMQVLQSNEAVLTANHSGVDGHRLHASTYLIVGGRSRFEDYGTNRTGCFWVGG